MESAVLYPLLIVLLTYAAIALDLVHRTVAALLGAVLLVNLGYLPAGEALRAVHLETILLLLGMMLALSVVEEAGLFEKMTLLILGASRRSQWRLLAVLAVATAVASAFIDNVTCVMLLSPMALEVSQLTGTNPVPFLLTMAFASSLGGTATLIGDPPNMMIGTAAGLSFMDFVANLAPIVALNVALLVGYVWLVFRRDLSDEPIGEDCVLECQRRFERREPARRSQLRRCTLVLAATLVAFALHARLRLEPYMVALSGGTALLLLTGIKPDEALRRIEWSTLVFFAGLFVVVGAMERAGAVRYVAARIVEGAAGSDRAAMALILWVSGALSSVVDNIPITAAMIPIIRSAIAIGSGHVGWWWALSLGVCLGGNATVYGASANVVVRGLAEREGYPVSFWRFMLYGAPLAVITMLSSTLYLFAFYT